MNLNLFIKVYFKTERNIPEKLHFTQERKNILKNAKTGNNEMLTQQKTKLEFSNEMQNV